MKAFKFMSLLILKNEASVFNPIDDEIMKQEEIEDCNLKSRRSICNTLKIIKRLLDCATFNDLDSEMKPIIKLENILVSRRLKLLQKLF